MESVFQNWIEMCKKRGFEILALYITTIVCFSQVSKSFYHKISIASYYNHSFNKHDHFNHHIMWVHSRRTRHSFLALIAPCVHIFRGTIPLPEEKNSINVYKTCSQSDYNSSLSLCYTGATNCPPWKWIWKLTRLKSNQNSNQYFTIYTK